VDEPTRWDPVEFKDEVPDFSLGQGTAGSWKLAFAPDNPATRQVAEWVRDDISEIGDIQGYDSEEAFISFMASEVSATLDVLGGIIFVNDFEDNDQAFPENIYYKIRLRAFHLSQEDDGLSASLGGSSGDWRTGNIMPVDGLHGPREEEEADGGDPFYRQEGFLALQLAVEKAVAKHIADDDDEKIKDINDIDVRMQRFPYPPYLDDDFLYVLEAGLHSFTYIALTPTVFSITKELVLEKERRLKEMMKLMGMSSFVNWLAWITKYMIMLTISMLIFTFVVCIDFGTGAIMNQSDFTVIFVYYELYAFSTICFCFAVSVFFSKANNGALAAGVIFLLSILPYEFTNGNYGEQSASSKIIISIFNNAAMAYGARLIAQHESQGGGLQWDNLGETPSLQENITMAVIFSMFIIDSIIYLLIAWYFEKLYPGDYGIPERWYFPCSPSYWCGSKSKSYDEESTIDQEPANEFIERGVGSAEVGIRIKNLRKEFKKKKKVKVAVAGTSLDMYEGQITALLGHNGAGKTTTISMLTGFMVPTSGTAVINSYDIRREMDKVRNSLGLCPQHDVLFETLTVKEHLEFFGTLKGCPKSTLDDEVSDMISLLHLEDKTNVQSANLSGGMKRKLSVGMALIGGSKVVVLDEPSSGVDPAARRQLWDILQSQREGRTMLLTTHFMDEADYLGDRIAIMASGKVKCCGSSLFLKSKYGVGYHMVIVKDEGCDSSKVKRAVQHYVPTATVESNISAELSFLLPSSMSPKFEEMFTYLEQNKEKLKINSYGASITTMEEVFLKVGQEDQDESVQNRIKHGDSDRDKSEPVVSDGYENPAFSVEKEFSGYMPKDAIATPLRSVSTVSAPREEDFEFRRSRRTSTLSNGRPPSGLMRSTSQTSDLPPVFGEPLERSTGSKLYMRQFRAMFIKRIIHTFRNKVVILVQLSMPLLFCVLGCVIYKTLGNADEPDPQPINYEEYMDRADQFVVYGSNGTTGLHNDLAKMFCTFIENNVTGVEGPLNEPVQEWLWQKGDEDIANYNLEYMTAASFEALAEGPFTTRVTAMFNNQAFHTTALIINMIGNSMLKLVDDSYNIQVENHPLPRTQEERVEEEVGTDTWVAYFVMTQVLFGLSFLVGSFSIFLIKERAVKAKHIQFVSGVHAVNFWLSTFLWDFINYIIPATLLLPILYGFDIPGMREAENLLVVWMLLIFYAWAVIPMVYVMSFMFTVSSTGFIWITVLFIFLGNSAAVAVTSLSFPEAGTEDIGEALEWLFYVLLPNFGLNQSLQNVMINHGNEESCSVLGEQECEVILESGRRNPCCPDACDFCITYHDSPVVWADPGVGRGMVFMFLQGCFFFAMLAVIESGVMNVAWQAGTSDVYDEEEDEEAQPGRMLMRRLSHREDSDVAEEKARVMNTPVEQLMLQNSLILAELRKYYGNFRAVNKITVGIPQGECFGLLGVNGAGKTTTFKMMTGDELISSGDAYLDGYSVNTDIKQVQQRLGYCPQFDALIEQMTVREHLFMYARLRGVEEYQISDMVDQLMDSLLISEHADKESKDLSGGNKRKLSTAIALVGDPPIVFLDEPTTGMDPLARRLLWDSLTKVRASGRTLVLTSHSMEECEALCTRLAIMVNGEFKCLGSPQHLKNKFGEGYSLMARVGGITDEEVEDRTRKLMDFIESSFPGCQLKDMHQGLVHYQIEEGSTTWARTFGIMERNKEVFDIKDYSVSQTTLEQVFISFAKAQTSPSFTEVGFGTKCLSCCKFTCTCGCCRACCSSGSHSGGK